MSILSSVETTPQRRGNAYRRVRFAEAAALLRRRRLGITAAALPTTEAADLEAGGLEDVAALRADRQHLRADSDIAQLTIDLLAHLAVGGQLHVGGLPVPGC